MTFTLVSFLSVVLGITLVVVSLHYAKTEGISNVSKLLSELFMKLAIVVFGVFAAFVAFFGQRWLEDTNKKIDEANEALANIDIVQSEYMSDIEASYFNNSCDFQDLVKGCSEEYKKRKADAKYCERDISASGVSRETILSGIDFFDYSPPETILSKFSENISSITYIKRTIISTIVRDIFEDHANILLKYGLNVDEVNSIRKDGPEVRKRVSSVNKKSSDGDKIANEYAHSMCCSVFNIFDNSEEIRTYASLQADKFCRIRKQIRDNILGNADYLVMWLARTRMQEINQHVANYTSGKEVGLCEFVPKKKGTGAGNCDLLQLEP